MGNTKNKAEVKKAEEKKAETDNEKLTTPVPDTSNENEEKSSPLLEPEPYNPKRKRGSFSELDDDSSKKELGKNNSNTMFFRDIKGFPEQTHESPPPQTESPTPQTEAPLSTEPPEPPDKSENKEELNEEKDALLNEAQNLSLQFDDRNKVLIIPDVDDTNTFVTVDFLMADPKIQVGRNNYTSNRNSRYEKYDDKSTRAGLKNNCTCNVRPYRGESDKRRKCHKGNCKSIKKNVYPGSPSMLNFNLPYYVPTDYCGQYKSFIQQCRPTPVSLPSSSRYNGYNNFIQGCSSSNAIGEDQEDIIDCGTPSLNIPVVFIRTRLDDTPSEEDTTE